jgi:hypothetical protein
MPDSTGRPYPSDLFDSVIVAIARATSYKPDTVIDHWLVIPAALQHYGIDLKTTPFRRDRPNPKVDPVGLDKRVRDAYRNLHKMDKNGWFHASYSKAHGGFMTVAGTPKKWALTEAGVERAKQIDKRLIRKMGGTPNFTGIWLGQQLQAYGGMQASSLFKALASAIASKCPVSKSSGQVEDHVSEFILRQIHRDSLRDRIMAGKTPSVSHLCSYAVRSAFTDARNSGTNPVCRALYGARTETERRKAAESGEDTKRWSYNDTNVTYTKGDNGMTQILDIVVNDDEEIYDRLYFNDIWKGVMSTLQKGKPKVFKRYAEVLEIKSRGFGTDEVACAMGVSKSRASSMIAEARRVVREARDEGLLDNVLTGLAA